MEMTPTIWVILGTKNIQKKFSARLKHPLAYIKSKKNLTRNYEGQKKTFLMQKKNKERNLY